MDAATQNPPIPMPKWVPVIQTGVVGMLCFAAYHSMFVPLITEWYEHENFSYGFLIPFISAYLVWERREAFQHPSARPSRVGLLSLAGALLLGMIGDAAGEPFLSRVSFVLVLVALIHLFWGWACVKRLAFPLGYLFLMIPPPYPIVKEVSYLLRMFDAAVAEISLRWAGVPIYRDAYFLQLPNITLVVADICSGIASLFAMGALGTLYAYYLPARNAAKVALLGGALLFPIAANLFRIFLIGFTVYYYGPIMLGAFFHRFTGTFTFLLSLAMMLVLGEALRRRYPAPAAGSRRDECDKLPSRDGVTGLQGGSGLFSIPAVSAITMMAFSLAISLWTENGRPAQAQPNLEQLSNRLGSYTRIEGDDEVIYSDPKAETVVSRLYRAPNGSEIEVFVGYRSRQFGDERLRSPKLVFPKGWEYASMDRVGIPIPGDEPIDAIWLLTRKGTGRKLVIYWYQIHGVSFASDFRHRVELIGGLILRGRTDGSVVRLATPVGDFEGIEQAKQRLVSFASRLQPELMRILPQ